MRVALSWRWIFSHSFSSPASAAFCSSCTEFGTHHQRICLPISRDRPRLANQPNFVAYQGDRTAWNAVTCPARARARLVVARRFCGSRWVGTIGSRAPSLTGTGRPGVSTGTMTLPVAGSSSVSSNAIS